VPFAVGGEATVGNIELRCRPQCLRGGAGFRLVHAA
jgi:hypothetical protein